MIRPKLGAILLVASAIICGIAAAQDWSGPAIGIEGGYAFGTAKGDISHGGFTPTSFHPAGSSAGATLDTIGS